MWLAKVATVFTGGEADQFRPAMATWKRGNGFERLHNKFVGGTTGRGCPAEFAERRSSQVIRI